MTLKARNKQSLYIECVLVTQPAFSFCLSAVNFFSDSVKSEYLIPDTTVCITLEQKQGVTIPSTPPRNLCGRFLTLWTRRYVPSARRWEASSAGHPVPRERTSAGQLPRGGGRCPTDNGPRRCGGPGWSTSGESESPLAAAGMTQLRGTALAGDSPLLSDYWAIPETKLITNRSVTSGIKKK